MSRSGAWLLDLTDSSIRLVLSDPTAEGICLVSGRTRMAFHSRRSGQWGIWILDAS